MVNIKEKIPATVRNTVWNKYQGKDNRKGICFCCNNEDISVANFQCGHVISEKNKGKPTIDNLRPICGHCNASMGSKNMEEFMTKYGFEKCKNWLGVNNKDKKIKKRSKNKKKIKENSLEETEKILQDVSLQKTKDILLKMSYSDLTILCNSHNIIFDKNVTKKDIIEHLIMMKFNYDDYVKQQLLKLDIVNIIKICENQSINYDNIKKELVDKIIISDFKYEKYKKKLKKELESLTGNEKKQIKKGKNKLGTVDNLNVNY